MLPKVTERPVMPDLFSIDRPPRVEDVENFYSWPGNQEAGSQGGDVSLLDLLPKTSDLPQRKRKLMRKRPAVLAVPAAVPSAAESGGSPVDDTGLVDTSTGSLFPVLCLDF
ncbi:unnamed protein product [Urochloa humidicola]